MPVENTIQTILRAKPYLSTYFNSGQEIPPNFILEVAKNGTVILVSTEKGPLASRYDPKKEAIRIIPDSLKSSPATRVVILLGIGNPEIFSLILSNLKEGQICIALDAHFEIGQILCQAGHQGLIQYLQRPGSHLFCGEIMMEAFLSYLDSLPKEKLSGVTLVAQNPSVKLNPEYYHTIEESIRTVFKSHMSDLLTRFEFEKIWIKNILINTEHLPDKKENPSVWDISAYEGALKGMPAVLVSAGPSLRKSLDHIRELSKKSFILSCDTSAKVLFKSGIIPHGIITLDAQKHSLFHFLGEDLSRTILFADIVSDPSVLRKLRPRGVVFSTTAKIIYSADGSAKREATAGTLYAEEIHGPLGSIQSGGSVATTGYDLLRYLGAGKIFLLGQDLAYTGREIHSTGTHHNERWLGLVSRTESLERINEAVIRKRETFPVKCIRGGEVLTDYVLDLYRRWFEQSIPVCPVETWNLSSNGALLENAKMPDDVDQMIRNLPDRTIPDLLRNAPIPLREFQHQQNKKMYTELKEAILGNQPEDFFKKHESIRPLMRKSEIYLKRNILKMKTGESENIHKKNGMKALKELERGLRPYFGDDAG